MGFLNLAHRLIFPPPQSNHVWILWNLWLEKFLEKEKSSTSFYNLCYAIFSNALQVAQHIVHQSSMTTTGIHHSFPSSNKCTHCRASWIFHLATLYWLTKWLRTSLDATANANKSKAWKSINPVNHKHHAKQCKKAAASNPINPEIFLMP